MAEKAQEQTEYFHQQSRAYHKTAAQQYIPRGRQNRGKGKA